MKRASLILALTLLLTSYASVTAQTTENSTPKTSSVSALSDAQRQLDKEADAVKREAEALRMELRMRRLLDEVKAGRRLIVELREEVKSADAQLAAEKENSASLEKSKTFAESESALKGEVIALKSEALGISEKDRARLKREVSKQRKRVLWLSIATASITALFMAK